jgi:hypothetical protein
MSVPHLQPCLPRIRGRVCPASAAMSGIVSDIGFKIGRKGAYARRVYGRRMRLYGRRMRLYGRHMRMETDQWTIGQWTDGPWRRTSGPLVHGRPFHASLIHIPPCVVHSRPFMAAPASVSCLTALMTRNAVICVCTYPALIRSTSASALTLPYLCACPASASAPAPTRACPTRVLCPARDCRQRSVCRLVSDSVTYCVARHGKGPARDCRSPRRFLSFSSSVSLEVHATHTLHTR